MGNVGLRCANPTYVSCDPSRFIDEMGEEGIRRKDRKSQEPVSKEDARARIANLRAMLGNKPGTIG